MGKKKFTKKKKVPKKNLLTILSKIFFRVVGPTNFQKFSKFYFGQPKKLKFCSFNFRKEGHLGAVRHAEHDETARLGVWALKGAPYEQSGLILGREDLGRFGPQ